MGIAAGAAWALAWKTLAGAPLRSIDRLPHLTLSGQAEAVAEYSADPLALLLDHRQKATRRVDEPGEEETRNPRRDDPPVERKLSTMGSEKRR